MLYLEMRFPQKICDVASSYVNAANCAPDRNTLLLRLLSNIEY